MSLCPWLSSSIGPLCWLELSSVAARYKWRVKVLDTLAALEVDKIYDIMSLENCEVECDTLLWRVWFEFSTSAEGGVMGCVDLPLSSTVDSCRDVHENDHGWGDLSITNLGSLGYFMYSYNHVHISYWRFSVDTHTDIPTSILEASLPLGQEIQSASLFVQKVFITSTTGIHVHYGIPVTE